MVESLGVRCVMAVAWCALCRTVYLSSFPDLPAKWLVENVRTTTRKFIDGAGSGRSSKKIDRLVPYDGVICAGFPCQPTLRSGARIGVREQTRSTLFFDLLEVLRAKHQKYLMLENV